MICIKFVILFLFLLLNSCVNLGTKNMTGPDCSEGYPKYKALVWLKNNKEADISKLKSVEVEQVLSSRVTRNNYKQLYKVDVVTKKNIRLSLLVIHTASFEECSMDQAKVYLVDAVK